MREIKNQTNLDTMTQIMEIIEKIGYTDYLTLLSQALFSLSSQWLYKNQFEIWKDRFATIDELLAEDVKKFS